MCDHTGPHASFYPLPSFHSLSLALAAFVNQLLPRRHLKCHLFHPYRSITLRFTQVTKIEVRNALFEHHSRASEGVRKCASRTATAVNPRRQPCLG